MEVTNQTEYLVEQIAYGGKGIVRKDGKVVFVPGVLLNETISLGNAIDHGGFMEAEYSNIIEASPQRLSPPCPHYAECGGCDFQYASYASQVEHKVASLAECWRRTARLPMPEVQLLRADSIDAQSHYRSRMQLHLASEKRWGLKERAAGNVISVPNCLVAVQGLLAILAGEPPPASPPRPVVFADLKGKSWVQGRDRLAKVSIDGTNLQFSLGGFFQSNLGMLEQLSRWLRQKLKINSYQGFLDLYGGVGTFAALLAGQGKSGLKGWVVEQDIESAKSAEVNLANSNMRVYCGTVAAWSRRHGRQAQADLVLVDPPRNGLEKPVIEFLLQHKPRTLVYVSCNPVTQARDFALLHKGGYHVGDYLFADFYPQTWHLETCLVAHLR